MHYEHMIHYYSKQVDFMKFLEKMGSVKLQYSEWHFDLARLEQDFQKQEDTLIQKIFSSMSPYIPGDLDLWDW